MNRAIRHTPVVAGLVVTTAPFGVTLLGPTLG